MSEEIKFVDADGKSCILIPGILSRKEIEAFINCKQTHKGDYAYAEDNGRIRC